MLSSIFAPLLSHSSAPKKLRHFRAFVEPKGGGPTLTVRALCAEDKHELQSGFRALSAAAKFQRFFSDVRDLSSEQWDYLTDIDGVDHVAIVAIEPQADLSLERGVAVARFMRLPNARDTAEIAITVIDSMQGKGLGSALLRLLIVLARERGIKRFHMEVLRNNAGMFAVLRHFANVELVDTDGEVDTLVMRL
jgi:GNAT superfamily N-acetyltransferase